ncbi:carnitine O-acetyltransferase-like [Anabas testudineus]|uniref:carnitine O-acetyltransferase-like n=1 Tax=Anabas testudineus TaxID=64144 RepID=UPI000E461BFB|nr:carnitine O-acetyltransferase-like [Anabas testudineus]
MELHKQGRALWTLHKLRGFFYCLVCCYYIEIFVHRNDSCATPKCPTRRSHLPLQQYQTRVLLELVGVGIQEVFQVLNWLFAVLTKDIRDKQGQIRCAAEFTASVLDIKTMVDNGTLPVEYMRGKPLCMKQYEQVFSSCRIPGAKTDFLLFDKSSNPPKNITVVHNGQFFLLDIYNSDGTLLTVDQLCVQLERICNSSLQTNVDPVGILTTQRRDVWSKSYISLMQDETNKESLSAIESSILTLCLDGPMSPVSDERMCRKAAFFQMLHGGGSQWYSGNRWFDKGLQVIIGEDGHRGINCGHTVADGTVFMAICDHAVANTNQETPNVIQTPSDPLPMPQKLHFNITPEIKQDIEEAKQHLDTVVQNVDVEITVFDHFGKNAIKARKMSPDAFVQMAIQLAYYRVYQQCCVTVEPASLRTFRLGRLAVIRPTSSASVAFVKAFDDPNKQNLEKVDLLEKTLKEHKKSTEMAMSGQDIAEHLIGLMCQASEKNIPEPDVFTDTSGVFHVTTSQLSSKTGCLTCNTLDQPGTYDVSYSIMDSHIDCRVSSIEASNTCKEKDPARLSRALEDALLDMMTLLEETPRVKP